MKLDLALLLSMLWMLSTGDAAMAGSAAMAEPGLTASQDHPHPELAIDPALSLQEAVARTAEREAGMAVVEARVAEASALGRDAGRLLAAAPTLVMGNINDVPFDDDGYRQWDAGLELPLWWPGQRRGRRRSAQAALAASHEARRAHRLEVAGWVRESIAELALARLRLELAESAWQTEEAFVAQVARAVEVGELARTELLLAESVRLERHLEYLAALEEVRHSEATYALLTGLDSWPASWEEAPAQASSFERHPYLLLAAEEVERVRGELERVTGDQWGSPVLALGTQHERESRGASYSDRIVVGVRIPVGRRGAARTEIAAMARGVSERRRDMSRLERDLRGRLAMAQHARDLAAARIASATEQAGVAAEALRMSELGFALGEVDLGDLLRARARSSAAEQMRLEALLLRRIRTAQLNQALGVLP